MVLFATHLLLLLLLSLAAAWRLARPALDRVLATFVLAWANIVVTCLGLASVGRLGDSTWFFRASLLLALGAWLLIRRTTLETAAAEPPSRPNPALLIGLLGAAIPILWMSLRVAATYEPNNYDSLAYHLPRAMYYIGQGDLSHFDTGNPRQIYFPLNYNLLQLFGLIYSPPLQVLTFFNLASWAVAALALYRICRLSALGPNAALLASWLAAMSTQVLAQATATTNDLPTAAALLCALLFGLRWRQSRLRRDALLTGLAAGLAAGTKLTVVFFGPAAGLLGLFLAWQAWHAQRLREFMAGLKAWILPAVLALALASPFAVINLAEKGEWINKTYDFTLNRPFSLACASQTTQAYLVQLFIEPLHRFVFDPSFTDQLNAWGTRTFFPRWNEAYAFSPLYLFPPDLNEDHVWFGLVGPAIFLAGLWCLVRGRRLPSPIVWLAWLGLGWFATYFLLNKWSLYNQRYFVPAFLVLSPCLAAAIESGWAHVRRQRATRNLAGLLVISSIWLSTVYLAANTSRPYAPLWAGRTPPPALPALPPLMHERLAPEQRINVHSTDGNERIFLLMCQGPRQRFTSHQRTLPDAYNVYSEWGFVRKVAYSNIEQLSSYTVVEIPEKRTAGVEFLGTIGSGQPSLDYYGLAAHAEQKGPTPGNRNLLVEFHYAPREPGRYSNLRLLVAGLNAADKARLTVGVDFTDGTSAELAGFTGTGEAKASVTRPFKRFTLRVHDLASGRLAGSADLPYLPRDLPPDVDTPHDPLLMLSDQFIVPGFKPRSKLEGLTAFEGPYPQWDLPVFRWAKSPVVRIELPELPQAAAIELSFELCLHARESALIDVVHNGEIVKNYLWEGRTRWLIQHLVLKPKPGPNVIEFRNVAVGRDPDWLDYLDRYPDVKDYVVAQKIPLEQGAREHWEAFGRRENRALYNHRQIERLPGTEQLYFLFRNLRVEARRLP